LERLEQYYLDVISRKKRGVIPFFLRILLWGSSLIFRGAVFLRNRAYDLGLFSCYTPPLPVVVSIGNIVAGGAGKTPVTLLLAQFFYDQVPIAILSRGYRSEAERLSRPVVLSKGFGPLHPASYGGDEPYLMSKRMPKAYVVVGRSRKEAADIAARLGAKIAFVDDGLQHRHLGRDFEVIVMDATDPWGLGHFLPRGLLREGKSALKRADLIILNHVEEVAEIAKIKRDLARYTSAPIVTTDVEVEGIFDAEKAPISQKDARVALFCGIAKPSHFAKTCKKLGLKVIGETVFNDHEQINFQELAHWAEKMKMFGAEALLCTEKDFVKCPAHFALPLPIWWVKVGLRIVEGKEELEQSIERISALLEGAVR
jgi:tetraacyldisaccharide 4'-kinase